MDGWGCIVNKCILEIGWWWKHYRYCWRYCLREKYFTGARLFCSGIVYLCTGNAWLYSRTRRWKAGLHTSFYSLSWLGGKLFDIGTLGCIHIHHSMGRRG